MTKMNKKGFTLIEMLVVIAIIAVLVSIVIPTVSTATEKAKEAADVANIRSAIAEVTTNALSNGDAAAAADPKTIVIKQGNAGFQSTDITSIGGIDATNFDKVKNAVEGQTVEVGWDETNKKITITVEDKGNT